MASRGKNRHGRPSIRINQQYRVTESRDVDRHVHVTVSKIRRRVCRTLSWLISALEVFLNNMRYINNSSFTYILPY